MTNSLTFSTKENKPQSFKVQSVYHNAVCNYSKNDSIFRASVVSLLKKKTTHMAHAAILNAKRSLR